MQELFKYIKDVRFYVPVLFLVLFEVILQTGVYRHVLEPNSYAYNINHVIRVVRDTKFKPNMLVLGTSVAYQGIQIKTLNDKWLKPRGLSAQSAACEGAKLGTQHLIYKAVKDKLPSAKVVVHVSEVTFPWTARYSLDKPNRSMIAQLPRSLVFSHLRSYDAKLTAQDYSFFLVRSLTYQKDLRDLALAPAYRLKKLSRKRRAPKSDYVYLNETEFGMSAYPANTLDECIQKARAAAGGKERLPRDKQGKLLSDRHHRNAVEKTCFIGKSDPRHEDGGDQWVRLYFKRLKLFYDEIHADGRRVVILFPPYSNLVRDLNADNRVAFWKKHLKKICGKNPCPIIDMRRALDGPNNADYYYDTIHLNKIGADKFTGKVAERLLREPTIRGLKTSRRETNR